MPRLYRPKIPLVVKCRVALRQLGEMWPEVVIEGYKKRLGVLHRSTLWRLADLLGCTPDDLHLDHNPPLAARKRHRRGRKTYYVPDANDSGFLIYREKHAHHIKTNVRGDGAQYPDRVLIKREKARREGKRAKPKREWPKRKLKSANTWPKKP